MNRLQKVCAALFALNIFLSVMFATTSFLSGNYALMLVFAVTAAALIYGAVKIFIL